MLSFILQHLKVRFNLNPDVHVIRTWSYAYRQARKSYWEQIGRDRVRFHDRVNRMANILDPILAADHRQKIFNDRFLQNRTEDNISGWTTHTHIHTREIGIQPNLNEYSHCYSRYRNTNMNFFNLIWGLCVNFFK